MAKPEHKKKTKKKSWEQQEEPKLTKTQKAIAALVVVGLLLGVFVVWPMLTRMHYVKTLKLPEKFFLSEPKYFDLISSPLLIGSKHDVNAVYKVELLGVEFKIPKDFTPTAILPDSAVFRREPRRWGQEVYIKAAQQDKPIEYTKRGFTRWFMPQSRLKFFEKMLGATWHPVRLMFKAGFYAAEGIAGPVFETKWNANHKGFVFPTSGAYGYIARVFRTDAPGYFEFLYQDTVEPITLQEWVNLAMKIKPPQSTKAKQDAPKKNVPSFADLISKAEFERYEADVLGKAITMFFDTNDPKWLIPVAKVMERRGFYSELIEFYHSYSQGLEAQTAEKQIWNKLLKQSVEKIINLQIDPSMNMHEIHVYCQNLTDLLIQQIWVEVHISPNNSKDQSFELQLLDQGRLYPHQEKALTLKTPLNISFSDSESLDFEVKKVVFAR